MDNYPTDEDLERIVAWDTKDLKQHVHLWGFIESLWWMPEWGFRSETGENELGDSVVNYYLSTGGWSGNESIIGALKKNFLFWSMHWVQSRRGGHYIFEFKVD